MSDLENGKKLYGETQDLTRLSEPLTVDQIEFRVQSISASGWAILLAYKNARIDMDRLDAVVGRGFWQRKHERIGNDLFASVGIYNRALGEWIWVQDVGVPSNTEAVKGEASDSFKRACFNLGIGRELYDYPLLMVQLRNEEFTAVDDRGKKRGKATYALKLDEWTWHIKWTDPDANGKRHIISIQAVDQTGTHRLSWPRGTAAAGSTAQDAQQNASQDEKPWYNDFARHKDYLQTQLNGGMTHKQIIDKLRETWRVSKKTESEINALVKQ